jgi:DNA helicase-2/ATP-dependent DNA helicase PcrA
MAVPTATDLTALNEQQLEAVTHGEGPQLVIAGAGSGKTRVITYRIAWLVRELGIAPETIAAVTFTNKAASEMRERVGRLLDAWPLPTFVGTFHRWALVQLRRYGERIGLHRGFAILDTQDQLDMVKRALEAEGLAEESFPPRAMLAAISGAKNRLIGPAEYERTAEDFFSKKVALVYRRYQGLLNRASGIDFDDMLALTVRLMEREPEVLERLRERARYLLVDEYQDTNHAQLELVRILAGPQANLTAVGDEDQGIYRWRGAELQNILRFEHYFPGATVRKLERNYRSTQNILDAAGELVAHNRSRRGKTLWTDAGAGAPIEVYRAADEMDEARWIVHTLRAYAGAGSLSETAILVRTNAQTRSLEDELMRQGVPYSLVGGTRFYERAEIKDLIAYLRVLRNPYDAFSLERILNQPPRGIGKATQELLRQEAERLGQPVWDVLYHRELGSFSARAAGALGAFRDLIVGLQEEAEVLPLPALLLRLLEATRYTGLYSDREPDGRARLENIEELLSAAQEFVEARGANAPDDDLLTAFLDHVALVSDVDAWRPDRGVSLMTLHSAKGLEFDAVAVGGLEDGLLPHFNAQATDDEIEEERRLLYVGMTRARERLALTTCRRRMVAGRWQDRLPSPFLAELPAELLDVQTSPGLFTPDRRGAEGVRSFFERRPLPGVRTADGTDAEPGDALRRGSRVRHPTLGEGTVLALEGLGQQGKLTVYFDRAGKRKLLAKYANLELL